MPTPLARPRISLAAPAAARLARLAVRLGARLGARLGVQLGVLLGLALPAGAFDFFDGRLEVHGFYEAQLRAMSRDFDTADGFDLTQWWNIFNIEMEADLAPNGLGPFELVEAFVRIEARYDCVWTRACGLSSSVDTFGNRANRVPKRLGDGRRAGYRSSGNIFNGEQRALRDIPRAMLPFSFSRQDPADLSSGRPRDGDLRPSEFFTIQGIDTLYDNSGIDQIFGNADDPSPFYFSEPEAKCTFNYRARKGSQNGVGVQIMGPWNPGCPIKPIGLLAGKPDPLSGKDYSPITASFGGPVPALPYRPEALNPATYAPTDPEVLSGQVAAGAPRPLARRDQSQGVYFPNAGLAQLLRSGDLDSFDQNFREEELAWNRGAGQQDEKELKEAYIEVEMFDSRLWLRAGKQQIVWGKTELFRNQDQWNPQDLALASLPSLEESRLALWALRGTWSFYEVGSLQDVRLELAMNYDQFEPTDLGRCGEPYAPNPVCNKTLGLFIHGVTGFGAAGEKRPPDPWNSLQGIEAGARLEWRWDRFSFAVTDFYGFTDIPFQETIFRYSRNVDPRSGRPRRGMSETGCDPEGFFDGDVSGCLGPDDDALENSPVNQQLFRTICATSIGFTALDPTACGQSVFNSRKQAGGAPLGVSVALTNIMSGLFTGRQVVYPALVDSLSGVTGGYATFIEPALSAAFPLTAVYGRTTPLVPLSDDDLTTGNPEADRGPLTAPEVIALIPPDQLPLYFGTQLLDGLSPALSDEQEALLGCGDFYGTYCDYEGIDLMNAEAGALFQSFPGWEGTFGRTFDGLAGGWNAGAVFDDAGDPVLQPGTVSATLGIFDGATPCTRSDGVLPGCHQGRFAGDPFADPAYDPLLDGTGIDTSGLSPIDSVSGLRLVRHPFAGAGQDGTVGTDDDIFFASEMARVSWNILQGLVAFSSPADLDGSGTITDADITIGDFNPRDSLRLDGCSYLKVQYCSSVQAFWQITGVQRNTRRAGGRSRFGRRDFTWHGGKDVALAYEKRNILGFSTDFAEDRTKSNWSLEFTWQDDLTFADNDQLDGLQSGVDTYNLTISVDRPTFINFLNPNRTFFLNSQLFTQYVDGHSSEFTSNGPWNFLWVAIIQTGYFDDRLLPRMAIVYDFGSNSGGFIPQVSYRFSADFNVTFGVALFSGREELRDMPLAPTSLSNRVGRNAYQDPVENGLSAIRDRDEAFLRVRYSF